MKETWQTFDLTRPPEVTSLDRATFESKYRGTSPIVVRGGAADMPAAGLWDREYLRERAGGAEVTVASYYADRRDFGSIRSDRMRLADFLAQMGTVSDEVRYLFNNSSCIFVRNEDRPEFHVGWAAQANPGLAPLATDFQLPSFIDPELFVLAVVILGSAENATDLHYDHGGEGKVLVQLRGRKRILLLPPSAAHVLQLNTLFPEPGAPPGRTGSRPRVDVHATASGGAPSLSGYLVELGPTDIAYWPPFWFHDIANLDAFTLATGIMVDEIRVPALLMRHVSHGAFRSLLAAARARAVPGTLSEAETAGEDLKVALGGQELGSLADLFRDFESDLLAEAGRGTSQLWVWNDRLGRRSDRRP